MTKVIDLRAGGKLHGRLDTERMELTVRCQDRITVYDISACVATGRPIFERFIEMNSGELHRVEQITG